MSTLELDVLGQPGKHSKSRVSREVGEQVYVHADS